MSTGWEPILNIYSCKKVLVNFEGASHGTPKHRKSRYYLERQHIIRKYYGMRTRRQAKDEVQQMETMKRTRKKRSIYNLLHNN